LGVFVGGARLEAIEAVVPAVDLAGADLADVLFDLVDASLVTVVDSEDGEPRFGLLETVRRFALDQLESTGRRAGAETAHAQYFYDLAGEPIAHFHDVARVRLVFVRDLANLDAVLNRGAPGVRHPGAYEGLVPAAHVAALLALGAAFAVQFAAADVWAHRGLDVAGVEDGEGRAALTRQLGRLAYFNGHNEEALRVCSEVWGQLEQVLARPVSSTLPSWVRADDVAAGAANRAGWVSSDLERFELAEQWLERLRGLEGRLTGISATYSSGLAYAIADRRGHLDQARQLLEENQWIRMSQGLTDIGLYQNDLADLDLLQGRCAAAQRRLAEHAEAVIEEGDPRVTLTACETMAAAMGPKHPLLCARVSGCASITRLVEGIPNIE